MRPGLRAALAGTAAFLATTVATIAVSTVLSDWERAPRLDPLDPGGVSDPAASTALSTVRTETMISLPGREADAVLVEPQGGADVGVVLVAGAGDADRHVLADLAERFAEAGVAALTYDKSTDYSIVHRDYEDLADDALAAVDAMRSDTGIERIGAWGISEGGWVVTAAAARDSTPLTFAVLASAPVVSPLEQSAWIIDRALQATPEPLRHAAAVLVAQGRFVLDYLDFDTRPLLASIRIPVMAVWGADDAIVPINEACRRLVDGLDGGLTARIVPGAGHSLDRAAEAWLPAVADWMAEPTERGIVGVEPASDLGVSAPVAPAWHADPRLHLAVSFLVAGGVVWIVRRRSKKSHGRTRT